MYMRELVYRPSLLSDPVIDKTDNNNNYNILCIIIYYYTVQVLE